MELAIFIATVMIIAFVLFLVCDTSSPCLRTYLKIRRIIEALQKQAATNITPLNQSEQLGGVDETAMQRQTAQIRNTIRFVYTIDEAPDGIVHMVSSQMLKPKSPKYQVQCMLVVMAVFQQQLQGAGIDPQTIPFNITESETGTQCLAMLLTSSQHSALLLAA